MAYAISNDCTGCRACAQICPTHAVTGEKKAPHTIDSENCIHCGACGRVCPSEAVSDTFGITARRIKKKKWERPHFDLDRCMSCAVCVETCPTGVIAQLLQKAGNPHLFPFLEDEKNCIACGFCAQDCPVDAIEMKSRQETPETAGAEPA